MYVFTRGALTALSNAEVNAIRDLGKANGFTVQSNGDRTQFIAENLARFRAVILRGLGGTPLTQTSKPRDPPQRAIQPAQHR